MIDTMQFGAALALAKIGHRIARDGGYLVLKTAQGVWQPGWNASQPYLLASDWRDLDAGEGPL